MSGQEARATHYVILAAGWLNKEFVEKMLCKMQRESIKIINPSVFENSYRYKLYLDEQLGRYDRLISAARRINT